MSDKKTLILAYGLSYLSLALAVNNSYISILVIAGAAVLLVKFLKRNRPLNIPAHLLLGVLQTLVFIFSLKSLFSVNDLFPFITGLNIMFSQAFLFAFYQSRKPVRKSTSFLTTVIFLSLLIMMLAADLSIKILLHSSEYGVLTGFWQMALIIASLNTIMISMPYPVEKKPEIKTKLVRISQ